MWKSLFSQIWNQRRANVWIWAELMIVVVLLWYGIDLVYNYEGAACQAKGYDTEHVYDITVNIKPILKHDSVMMSRSQDYIKQIYSLISHYPGVEEACYYYGSIPYTNNIMSEGYAPHSDSTHVSGCYIRYVNSSYFKVFRLKPVTGKFNATRWRASEYPMPALMSVALCDSIFHNPAAIGQTCFNPYFIGSKSPVTNYRVMAILSQHKLGDYERYEPFIYLPLSDDDMGWWMHFAVRVSPDAVSGFAGRFLNDMQPKLAIGPYYLYEVHSYSDMKEAYDLEQGTVNYLNATYSILSFFMFNVFLTILGTFWFRTRKRRSEIGLRMALGSSRRDIFRYYVSEGVLLLLLAAIPAFIISFNIRVADLTVHTLMEVTRGRFLFCFIAAVAVLALTILLGIWFPARRAMRIQPAEALHED